MFYQALKDGYSFSKSKKYISPPIDLQEAYITYIKSLPINTEPEAFGFYDNADII